MGATRSGGGTDGRISASDAGRPATIGQYYVVLPAYQEAGRIGKVIERLRGLGARVLVVDDGSTDRTAAEAEAGGATVLRHPENRGKGAALETGFSYARDQGCAAVITLDADGQHAPGEMPRFIEAYERTRIPVLVGNRMWDKAKMPLLRRLTNRFMSGLLSREMGQYVPDTQCGFRLFACDVIPYVAAQSQGFAAESETLLRLAARDIRIGAVRISTIYGDERSKIRPVRDTIRFYRMLRAYRRAAG